MAIFKSEAWTSTPNFLESEIGLITKTYELPKTLGTADGDKTIVKAGTVYPSDDAKAIGIVFQDIDVTDGPAIGSVMTAGRVLKDRLNVASAAITALTARGLYVIEGPDTEH